ncbi:TRAP transporter small permease [Pseudomonas stutzeri]|uniref:TRAP transporter small permease protein n=1 Tax=Stutzerimonas stutzeri TaxID=316 RepID=A0A2N8STZ3_STUST|nr:TRAP transporter small permease [Stutzerimonas stutzeri]MCQ4249108.1 TRAP transporter small permease [Stutzerimonas stutzeri]PNG05958.1 TRAP transporter small permease [Stutzerimonas stutzeri]
MSEPVVQAAQAPADPLGRWLDRLSRLLAMIGGLLLVAMTLMATYSIAMRALFDEPLLGDVELVQMGCGIAIVFFLPLCQLRRGNVIVDVFTLHAPERVRNGLDALGGVLMALASALLAWRSAVGTEDAFGTGEESIIMGLPIWWSMLAFAPGFALLALVSLYTAWQDFRGEGKPA